MQFRKLAAVAGTALMTGLTLAGPALAAGVTNVADIGSLAGVTDSTAVMPWLVVGADAKPSDVAAAINLAAYLAGNVYKTEKVAIEEAVPGADGATLRVEIDNTTAFTRDFDLIGVGNYLTLQPTTRGGRAATFLQEGGFTIGGTEYKYYEKIVLSNTNATGTTNTYRLIRGSAVTEYENALKDLGFTIPTNDISYILKFDTAVPVGTNNLTGQTIKFLGKDYTVTYSATNKIELSPTGSAVGLMAGEEATIGEYTVRCDSIATASGGTADAFITVCKGDVCSVSTGFKSGDTKTLTVGTESVSVTLQSVAYGASVSVLVGAAPLKLENGKTLENYPDWKVNIDAGTGTIKEIKLVYKRSHTSFSGTYPVLLEGDEITFPENFAKVKYAGLEDRDYYQITITPEQAELKGSNDEGVFLEVTDEDGNPVKIWDVGGGVFADKIAYDIDNGGWYYLNVSGYYQKVSQTPKIQLTEKTLNINYYDTLLKNANTATKDGVLEIKEPQLSESGFTKSIYIEVDENYASTGVPKFENVSQNDTLTNPVYFYYADSVVSGKVIKNQIELAYGGSSPKARSAFTTNYGTELVTASREGITIKVPKAQTYGDLIVGREAIAAAGEIETKTPIQITFDVAKLDTEIADPSALTTDVVVIGGPCVNKLAAELLEKDYPACGVESGIPENAALVQVFQNAFGSGQVAVLIAGWEAEHTDLAVAAIQAGKVTQAVPKVKISGTVAAPTIETLE